MYVDLYKNIVLQFMYVDLYKNIVLQKCPH